MGEDAGGSVGSGNGVEAVSAALLDGGDIRAQVQNSSPADWLHPSWLCSIVTLGFGRRELVRVSSVGRNGDVE